MRMLRMLPVGALSLLSVTPSFAQTPVDVSGHWSGSVLAPGMEVAVEIDLTTDAAGQLIGTFGQPAQHLSGLPLTSFALDGRAIAFQIKGGAPGQRAFKGDVSADVKSMSGEFASEFGTLPFTLTRTGDARIDPPSKSDPIAKELEGAWNGMLDIDGGLHFVMTLANRTDGTSTGHVLNVEQGLELPITSIVQNASGVTIDLKGVGASFAGALSADGSELAGTFSEGHASLPMTFHRANSETKK